MGSGKGREGRRRWGGKRRLKERRVRQFETTKKNGKEANRTEEEEALLKSDFLLNSSLLLLDLMDSLQSQLFLGPNVGDLFLLLNSNSNVSSHLRIVGDFVQPQFGPDAFKSVDESSNVLLGVERGGRDTKTLSTHGDGRVV